MSDRKRIFLGKSVMLIFDGSRCQQSGECTRQLPEVFDRRRDPWIVPDNADTEALIDTVQNCPTGALSCQSTAPPKQTIGQLQPGGPLVIKGQIMIIEQEGKVRRQTQYAALCRCGHSKNKPYCDGSHEEADITDSGEIQQVSQQHSNSIGGTVRIECQKDGPLKFIGNLTVENVRGQRCTKDKGFLCRCGKSGDKPFCDGTHRQIGFKAN